MTMPGMRRTLTAPPPGGPQKCDDQQAVMIVMTPQATPAEIRAVEERLATTGVHVVVMPGALDDGDRRHRRSRRSGRARPGGDERRRPRRPDLPPLQARLLRAQPPRADDRRGGRSPCRGPGDLLPDRRAVHRRVARAD